MPLESNNNKFISGLAFHSFVWCKPHQKLSLMPFFSWQIQSGEVESGSLFNICTWCFVVHSTEAFHLKLEIHHKVPPASLILTVIMKTATVTAFVVIGSFFWNSGRDSWSLPHYKVCIPSLHVFILLDDLEEVLQISGNLLQIWTSSGIIQNQYVTFLGLVVRL